MTKYEFAAMRVRVDLTAAGVDLQRGSKLAIETIIRRTLEEIDQGRWEAYQERERARREYMGQPGPEGARNE